MVTCRAPVVAAAEASVMMAIGRKVYVSLNDRQQAFVREYLLCHNAAEAYRRAGYSCTSPQSAASGAERLLRNVDIRAAIDAGRQAAQKRAIVTRDEILTGLKKEARRIKHGHAAARVSAWKLLAEMLGLIGESELKQMVADLMRRLDERETAEDGGGSPETDRGSGAAGATEGLPADAGGLHRGEAGQEHLGQAAGSVRPADEAASQGHGQGVP
jgi:hypothetical protein